MGMLSKRGYNNLELWDFSAWFRPQYYKKYMPTDQVIIDNYKSIPNKETAMRLLVSLPCNCVFVCLFSPNAKSIFIFNYMDKNQYKYGFISFGHFPGRNKLSMLKQALGTPSFILKKLVNLIFLRVYSLITLSSIEASFVILGGGIATSKYVGDKTIILKTHTLDYDIFLGLKQTPKERHKKYIVYLDDSGPSHPDDIDRNIAIDPVCYYQTLNSFLNKVESKLSMRVIVAPHPR